MKVLIYCLLTKLSKVLVSFFRRERETETETERDRDRETETETETETRQREREREKERGREGGREGGRAGGGERQREMLLMLLIDLAGISLEMKFLFEKDSNLSLLLNV